jgi:hypothetical protein
LTASVESVWSKILAMRNYHSGPNVCPYRDAFCASKPANAAIWKSNCSFGVLSDHSKSPFGSSYLASNSCWCSDSYLSWDLSWDPRLHSTATSHSPSRSHSNSVLISILIQFRFPFRLPILIPFRIRFRTRFRIPIRFRLRVLAQCRIPIWFPMFISLSSRIPAGCGIQLWFHIPVRLAFLIQRMISQEQGEDKGSIITKQCWQLSATRMASISSTRCPRSRSTVLHIISIICQLLSVSDWFQQANAN